VILALDVGDVRIGAAVGSTEARLARPYAVWRSQGRAKDCARIAAAAQEVGADLLLVGLPTQADGSPSPQAERIRRYVQSMSPSLSLPVVFCDETLSTQDAQARLRDGCGTRRHRHELEDAAAAAVILQAYLDGLQSENGATP